jgi:inosine-uridine nucleoside N-ribohydrolase
MKWHRFSGGILLVLSLLMSACGPGASTPAQVRPTALPVVAATTAPRNFVVDTDMAADDWMALLFLLRRPDVAVKAITVSGTGEAHCAPGVRHALELVAFANRAPIPVACGRDTPLQGQHTFPKSWRTDVDSLLGLTLPAATTAAAQPSAVELLTSAIQSSPHTVVVTLGPLTNLAEALQRTPSLVRNVEMVYVMGGAVNVPGNIGDAGVGIDNRAAEWNIYIDPHAAQVVFASGAPITLVPLDATNHAPLRAAFYQRLQQDHATPVASFVFDVLTKRHDFIQSGGYYFWDPLAAAVATDERLATIQAQTLGVVEAEGPQSGRTAPASGGASVRVAVSAQGPVFEQLFLDTLNDRVASGT